MLLNESFLCRAKINGLIVVCFRPLQCESEQVSAVANPQTADYGSTEVDAAHAKILGNILKNMIFKIVLYTQRCFEIAPRKFLHVLRLGIHVLHLIQESLVTAPVGPPAFLSELGLSGQRWDVSNGSAGRSH